MAIPYENLDIHLGRSLPLDEAAFVEKLVGDEARGGWCYEMNGCFAWALRRPGFVVEYVAGTVRRSTETSVEGDHLVLIVMLDRPHIADVGFGKGYWSRSRWKQGLTGSPVSNSGSGGTAVGGRWLSTTTAGPTGST